MAAMISRGEKSKSSRLPPSATIRAICSRVLASPVPTSEITIDLPASSPSSASVMTLGTLKAQITWRKKR